MGKMSRMKEYPSEVEQNKIVSIVEEPLEVYITHYASEPVLTWRVLGGKMLNEPLPKSMLGFFDLGKKGLPKSAVMSLASTLNLPLTQMADMLNISYKTLGCKKNSELMDSWVSSHAVEIASVVARGLSVFEDPNKLNRWLRKPNRALGGKIPMDLLQSPVGIRLIIQILGRIEEGVYS